MTRNLKLAAVLAATLATASCASLDQGGFAAEQEFRQAPPQVNATTLGAALLLAVVL
jgi:hypothetical protein